MTSKRFRLLLDGQTHSGGGTQYYSTDTCRICGLQREYFSDSQNGVDDRYTFRTHAGSTISLKDLVDTEPCLQFDDEGGEQ